MKNQLAEKHIVRIPVRYMECGLNLDAEHSQYINQVTTHLQNHLLEMVDFIIEEHQEKTLLKSSYGIEAALFEELNQQTSFCQKAAQCSINRDKTINEIKAYINSDSTSPLILFGPGGCGKTTLLARVAQCSQQWLPEAFLIFRFIGISAQSSTLEQLLSSITNQCSTLAYGYKCVCTHSMATYKDILPPLLAACCLQRPLIVLLDGIDQVRTYSSKSIEWLPTRLPDNVKLILSVSDGTSFHFDIGKKVKQFIEMPLLGEAEARGILMSSVMQYNHSINSKIQDCVFKSVQECTLPLYSKVLAWQSSWWADKEHYIVPKGHVNDQLSLMLEELETILGSVQVQHALAIMTSTKHGITDSEMIDLLALDENFHSTTTHVIWAPACLAWSRLNKHLAPFLQWTLTGGVLGVQLRDNMLRQAVAFRYQEHTRWANQMIYDYYVSEENVWIAAYIILCCIQLGRVFFRRAIFVILCNLTKNLKDRGKGKWWISKSANLSARLVSQETIVGKCYNRRKLDELPFQYYQLNNDIESSPYINDMSWIYDKVCGSSCYQILEDIKMVPYIKTEITAMLLEFIELYASVLNYDGKQFYSHLYKYLENQIKRHELNLGSNSSLAQIYNLARNPPVLSLMPLNGFEGDVKVEIESARVFKEKYLDLIVRLPQTDQFIVSISGINDEICVWDVKKFKKVRILKGIPHPANLIPIDQFRSIVLCRRELRIYDLNNGIFLAKLKGVMNQKMPYFGIHDQSHLVALSRNRMYVNLMNLETGDCVTTFKAGEDRFLNSLLVSGDGRILVCGDETQKPFPLLVWNLQSRKLLYDLRIPHHDFNTSLSAITFEGNYVCCVCHEIDEPNPNFIVVYDLQSGTLFKKWKPSCNTVSLEISSQGGCVISGLEDSRIFVWDLITGNCRWSLCGHTAPVSTLKLDPSGFVCLSADRECRDRSIRLWDLIKGHSLAVYTPKVNVTACEVTSHGQHVILALEGEKSVIILQLKGPNSDEYAVVESYGVMENCGKTFQLKEAESC